VQEYFERIKAPAADPVPALRPAALPVKASDTLLAWSDVYKSGDKLNIAVINKGLSLEAIVENDERVQISRYRANEPVILNDLLMRMLLDFSKSFHERISLSSDQIREIAAEIQIDYWHLTLEDVAVFLSRVKRGRHADLITALDANKVLTWLRKYDTDRTQLILQKRDSEKHAYTPIKDIARSTKTTTAKEEWEIAVTKKVIRETVPPKKK
jgi:hypothetical protein